MSEDSKDKGHGESGIREKERGPDYRNSYQPERRRCRAGNGNGRRSTWYLTGRNGTKDWTSRSEMKREIQIQIVIDRARQETVVVGKIWSEVGW